MALLDFLKKKKEKKPEPKKEVKKVEKKKGEPKPKAVAKKKAAVLAPSPPPPRKSKAGEAYKILKGPHVTERASDLTAQNQYVFKVWPRANKVQIKKAVEDVFGVNVMQVRIINVVRKKRRLGKIEGFRKGYKKAIVKIKEGQKIEILPR